MSNKEYEIVIKVMAEKIEKLENDLKYKDWKIDSLSKENEELKNIEKRPALKVEVETR